MIHTGIYTSTQEHSLISKKELHGLLIGGINASWKGHAVTQDTVDKIQAYINIKIESLQRLGVLPRGASAIFSLSETYEPQLEVNYD